MEISDDLVVSAHLGRLVPFIGAGVSKIAGGPTWPEFADGIFDQLVTQGALSYAELEQIKYKAMGPRMKISLAAELAKDIKIKIDYKSILHSPNWKNHENGQKIYSALWRLSKRFVTTNYDLWLDETDNQLAINPANSNQDKVQPRRIIYDQNNFLGSELDVKDRETVIHLHGSIQNPESMLLTTSDYLRTYGLSHDSTRYAKNKIHHFLQFIFQEKDILFMGYALDELEILEYLILKKKQIGAMERKNQKHFILQPFFKNDEKLINGVTNYFKDLEITLIPYYRDANNYDALIDILEGYASQMKIESPNDLERKRIMGGFLDGIN